jgi:hypothetical protein
VKGDDGRVTLVTRPSVIVCGLGAESLPAQSRDCCYGVQVVFMPFGAVSLLFFRRM